MKPDLLKTVRTRLGLTVAEMAVLLGAPLRSYYRWEKVGAPLTAGRLIVILLNNPQVLWAEITKIQQGN